MTRERKHSVDKLRNAYEDGASIRDLATSAGRSYGAVHATLRASGAKIIRSHGGKRPGAGGRRLPAPERVA
jgi:predicted transcriptional regulator